MRGRKKTEQSTCVTAVRQLFYILVEADSCANPIRASDFGQVTKINLVRAKIETGFLCEIGCGDGARVICFVCSCNSAVRFLNSENLSQSLLPLCLAPRRDAPSALRSALDSSNQACAD